MIHKGTYVIFDRENDYDYYCQLKEWEKEDSRLLFVNQEALGSDKDGFKTADLSPEYIRMQISEANNVLVILSPKTRVDDKRINSELTAAIWKYDMPVIFMYTDKREDFAIRFFTRGMFSRVPCVVKDLIKFHRKGFAHIPFTKRMVYVSTAHYGAIRYFPNRYNEVTNPTVVI